MKTIEQSLGGAYGLVGWGKREKALSSMAAGTASCPPLGTVPPAPQLCALNVANTRYELSRDYMNGCISK